MNSVTILWRAFDNTKACRPMQIVRQPCAVEVLCLTKAGQSKHTLPFKIQPDTKGWVIQIFGGMERDPVISEIRINRTTGEIHNVNFTDLPLAYDARIKVELSPTPLELPTVMSKGHHNTWLVKNDQELSDALKHAAGWQSRDKERFGNYQGPYPVVMVVDGMSVHGYPNYTLYTQQKLINLLSLFAEE